ncbi:MAG: cysteine desulfurase [Patiriisocius sp.]|jgi:cysteine desulfurase
MSKVYLDNAATTPLDPQVLEAMLPFMTEHFGNPSSIHSYGRKTKDAIETARRKVSGYLNCKPNEICFTSGGTEADNIAIYDAIHTHGVKNIITSRIEHHAVLNTSMDFISKGINVHFVDLDVNGNVSVNHLEELLQNHSESLVSLMHANNEIGNIIDLKAVSILCRKYNALLHSDTVQTMAHYNFDLSELDIDYIAGSAHKFHGPKGVGFLYHKKKSSFKGIMHGGSQERDHRAGTENLYGIVGLAKAMELAFENLDEHQVHVQGLKSHMINKLKEMIPGVAFNGESGGESLYTVLSVKLPENDNSSMLLFSLDLEGIAVSGGSACTSGSDIGSHVLQQLKMTHDGPSIRFSFSRMNTIDELDYCLSVLRKMYESTPV